MLRTAIITPYLTLRYVVRSGFLDIYPDQTVPARPQKPSLPHGVFSSWPAIRLIGSYASPPILVRLWPKFARQVEV